MLAISRWGANESPLFASEIEYKGKTQPVTASGYLLITIGAIYIFKKRILGGAAIRHHISPFDIITLDHQNDRFTMYLKDNSDKYNLDKPRIPLDTMRVSDYLNDTDSEGKHREFHEHYSITIKSKQYIRRIALTVFSICESALWKNETILHPKFRSNQIKFPVLRGPTFKGLLEKRAIIMAHYAFPDAKNLEAAEYFSTKWNDTQSFVISRGFHPAIYCRPFANALGYEYKLKSVCFDNAQFKEFPEFVNILAKSALTINLIAFANYKSNFNLVFDFTDLKDTNVLNWMIISCNLDILLTFVDSCIRSEFAPHRLIYGRTTLNQQNTDNFFDAIKRIKGLHAVKLFELNFVVPRFDAVQNFVRTMSSLVELEISHSSYDGSQLLNTICDCESNIMCVYLTNCKFNDVTKFNLPKKIAAFDFSNSSFQGTSLRDLIQYCVDTPSESKFALRLKNIRISESDLLNLKSLKPTGNANICEFDFSGNFIPKGAYIEILEFLASQTTLKMLCLESITSDAMTRVIPRIARYVKQSEIDTFFISGRIAPREYSSMLMTLLERNKLKRFHMVNSGAGNLAIKLLKEIIISYPIEEIACDGFKPDTTQEDAISDLWYAIARSQTIKYCDQPKKDVPSITKKKNAEPWQPYITMPYRMMPYDFNPEILSRVRQACGMSPHEEPKLKKVDPNMSMSTEEEEKNEVEDHEEKKPDEEEKQQEEFVEGDDLNEPIAKPKQDNKNDLLNDEPMFEYYSDEEETNEQERSGKSSSARKRRSTATRQSNSERSQISASVNESSSSSSSEDERPQQKKPEKAPDVVRSPAPMDGAEKPAAKKPEAAPPQKKEEKPKEQPPKPKEEPPKPKEEPQKPKEEPPKKKEKSSSEDEKQKKKEESSSSSDFDFNELLSKVGANPDSQSDSTSDLADLLGSSTSSLDI